MSSKQDVGAPSRPKLLWLVALTLGLNSCSNPVAPVVIRVVAESDQTGPADRKSGGDYAGQPPFDPDEFWTKVLALLNEHDGSVTKERFEQVFGVRFGHIRRNSDATTYFLHAGSDWYFNAWVTIYNDQFRSPGPENGAHVQWYINWNIKTVGDSPKQACLTAERVRASLVATGWTSPWQKWGIWEEMREAVVKNQPPGGYGMYPPILPDPISSFHRQSDDDSAARERLPQGRVYSDGDFPDSCVTEIMVTAKP